jgi:hypothetical protein
MLGLLRLADRPTTTPSGGGIRQLRLPLTLRGHARTNGVRTPYMRASSMEGDWLTYAAAAERLNTTPEAVRQKAIRGRWRRTIGNDKRALVRLPDGWSNPVRTPSERPNKPDVRTPSEPRTDTQLIKALEAHVETLKAQLAAAEARIDKQAEDLVAYDAAYAAGLAAERAKVEAERAKVEAERAKVEAERAKAERVVAEFGTTLKAEQAQTEKAIAAFSALAERLDALARPRPWWRRLAG